MFHEHKCKSQNENLTSFSWHKFSDAFLMKCPTYLQKFQKVIGFRPPTEFLTKENVINPQNYNSDPNSSNHFPSSSSNLLNPTCWNICQLDENCIGYVLSISTYECFGVSIIDENDGFQKLVASNDFLIADPNAIYFEKVCLSGR